MWVRPGRAAAREPRWLHAKLTPAEAAEPPLNSRGVAPALCGSKETEYYTLENLEEKMHNHITFQTTEDGTKIEGYKADTNFTGSVLEKIDKHAKEKSYPIPKPSNIASAADGESSRRGLPLRKL